MQLNDSTEIQIDRTVPAIYVASEATYPNGGVWIDARWDADEIYNEIEEWSLRFEEPQEWSICGCSGFSEIDIDEYESLEVVSRLGLAVDEFGEAFAIWWNDRGSLDTIESWADDFLGEYESEWDYLSQFIPESLHTMKINEVPIISYLDIDGILREMEKNGLLFVETSRGTYCVFS